MGRQATYRRAPKRRAVSPGAVRTTKSPSIRPSLPSTIEELIAVEPERLARFDIAWMNLMCATGLPGAGTLDINHFLKKLDEWARHVEKRTQRNLHQFKANPAYYENSEAYFRMLTLTTVLQLDFRVHYNLERIDSADWSDSEDLLIHGLLGPRRTGTCVSLPVLITAIGRRLGYPLKLVKGMAHLFCRWHDQVTRERFNIECHGRGMSCYPDEHYLTWPMEMPADVIKLGVFLTSIGPAEELGCFLAIDARLLP